MGEYIMCNILLTDLISISYIIVKKLLVFVEDQNKYITDLLESSIEHKIVIQ
jgi:hypothetical protein